MRLYISNNLLRRDKIYRCVLWVNEGKVGWLLIAGMKNYHTSIV